MTKAHTCAALLVAAAALSACGDDGGEATTADKSGAPAGVSAQYETVEKEIAAEGGAQETGDWRIAYIVEPAEGWHIRDGDSFIWRAPAPEETHHIEIVPFERSTGRIVPDVPIAVEVIDADGDVAKRPLDQYYAEFFR